ncbi:MAG: HAMP domain-containing sensor histidine kinase [bacterium]
MMLSDSTHAPLLIHTSSIDIKPVLSAIESQGVGVIEKTVETGQPFTSIEEASHLPLQLWMAESLSQELLEDLRSVLRVLPTAQVCLIVPKLNGDHFEVGIRAGAGEVLDLSQVQTHVQPFLHRAHRKILHIERLFHQGVYNASGLGFHHGAARLLHDINSPLTAIQNSFEMIEMDHEVSAEELNAKEKLLAKGIDSARKITDSWHEFLHAQDHPEAGCDLHAAIRNAANVVLADHPDITLETSPEFLSPTFKGSFPALTIQGGPHAYELIFFHLFSNAAEALQDATGGKIRVELEEEDSILLVTVEDNGPGIHPDMKNTLWKDFQTTKRNSGHFGMGLGIVRYLLMTVGGSIRFADQKKLGGAAFVIELRPWPSRKPM